MFFDTNVLVSAFATRGLCADLFSHVLLEHDLVVGECVLVELRRALRDRIKVPRRTIEEIDALLRDSPVVATPESHLHLGISDPDDEWIVAAAVAGRADVLVTGDSVLLGAAPRSPIAIVSPRGLWELLRQKDRAK
ncbi:MAG: putative toxin-antitoxin system toxin component, PIN family [Polyangiaceae bacterium]|nr:putative toxin-antitoxin system toxin component, PIN family [Polyangiaceae bacterium]